MIKCPNCCRTEEEYIAQFPTTLYEGIKCDKCGELMPIALNQPKEDKK